MTENDLKQAAMKMAEILHNGGHYSEAQNAVGDEMALAVEERFFMKTGEYLPSVVYMSPMDRLSLANMIIEVVSQPLSPDDEFQYESNFGIIPLIKLGVDFLKGLLK